jgi:predicted regulator of Ras-like GTPase activity (Roadblock/LC7/MglB family)
MSGVPEAVRLDHVEPAAALADLTEISSQIETAAVFRADGSVLASTFRDDALAERLVASARELLELGDAAPVSTGRALTQLEIGLREGSVFVVRDGELAVAATTSAAPTAGLVLYDLRTCLRSLAASSAGRGAAPRRRRPRKSTADA